MKKLIFFFGAAAFALGTPALAKHGKGQSAESNGKSQSAAHSKKHSNHIVAMRDGTRLYSFNARGGCPPGLAKRDNGCMPPGQAKKLFNAGQRYDRNFGNVWAYNQIPSDLRSRYQFNHDDRYYYRSGYLYQVDPRTMLIQQVVSAMLR